MSVGKTADERTILIFTQNGVTVHNEHKSLARGEPIITGLRDQLGCYCIPLVQTKGQGNHKPHSNASNMHYTKPTVSMTCQPLNKPTNGYMLFADNPSNPPGSKLYNKATLPDGHY